MTMRATVLNSQCDRLLVLAHETNQTVRVVYPDSCRFRPGNLVCIRYNGIMTASIPPQIAGDRITLIPWFGPFHNQCR